MPEHAPKYSSESPEKLMSLQNDHLSKMLADFHLQNSRGGKQLDSTSKETNILATPESSAIPKEPNIGPSRQSKSKKAYRNPLIYARELNEELLSENLTRKQLAEKHGISSDRVSQWFCLLKLPKKVQQEVTAMGDYWDKKKVTERRLRSLR